MNENLQFVIDFYQKSWDVLVWINSVAMIIVAIVWPIILFIVNNHYQKEYRKNINNKFKNMMNIHDNKINSSIEEGEIKLDNHIAESTKRIDEKNKTLDDRISKIEDNEYRIIGNMLFTNTKTTEDPVIKLFGLLNAFINFIKINDIICMAIVYNDMSPYFQNGQTLLTSNNISTEQKQLLKNIIDEVIDALKGKKEKMNCNNYIEIFEDFKNYLIKI